MNQLRESKYKKEAVRIMRERYGAKVVYIHGSAWQEPGLADTTIWTALPFVWHGEMEFKAHGGNIRSTQRVQCEGCNKRVPVSYLVVREHSDRSEDDGRGHLIYFHEIETGNIDYKGNQIREPRQHSVDVKDFDVLEALVRLHAFLNIEVDCTNWERRKEYQRVLLEHAFGQSGLLRK